MPTPHGSRGALVLSAAELRVLRSALALVLCPGHTPPPRAGERAPERAEVLRSCLHLAEALEEAAREADRMREFLLADLDRYRAALPGSAAGYLARLEEALAADCPPGPEDVAALRGLCALPAGQRERRRRAGLLERCERLCGPVPRPADPKAPARPGWSPDAPDRPGSAGPPDRAEGPPPAPSGPGRGRPAAVPRPVPTPAEVFPAGRRPSFGPHRQALPA